MTKTVHHPNRCCQDRRHSSIVDRSSGHARRYRTGIAAALALPALLAAVPASAQDANMSTTVAALGSSGAISRITIDAVTPRPATERALALPSLAVVDDGSGPRVSNLVLELPNVDLGAVSVSSRVGDQPLPAVFRASPLAGWGLASPMRGMTFTTTGRAPASVSFGQMPASTAGMQGPPAVAAAAVSFTPGSRLSVTPQVLIPGGAQDVRASVGTSVRAKVIDSVAVTTDVGVAGTGDTGWAPMSSTRLVGQWPRAGIETSVLRGTAGPRDGSPALVASRDREAAQAQVQPLAGLTVSALTSLSRPAADPNAADTVLGSLRVAYDGLPAGRVAAVRQREATAARESETTSLEWRQHGPGKMLVRFVHQRTSDSAQEVVDRDSSRVELELPTLANRCAGCPDLRAALTAGAGTPADSGVNSKLSGRFKLVDNAALTGETELGLRGSDGQVLRALRVTTDMPVVPTTRLQLSYSYRKSQNVPIGQVFEARLMRRVSLGW